MRTKGLKEVQMIAITLTISVFLIQGCVKAPVPAFSYTPVVNPEAGDSIFFLNESLNATSFDWDFGDGYGSTDMFPTNIYISAGSYDVILTATNEKSSIQTVKTIIINAPTALGLWVMEDDSLTPIADCEVWLYESLEDYQTNFFSPYKEAYTDSDGFALFINLEAQQYIIDMYKSTSTGYWARAVWTPALSLNHNNLLYPLPLEFHPKTTRKSLSNKIGSIAIIQKDKPLPPGILAK